MLVVDIRDAHSGLLLADWRREAGMGDGLLTGMSGDISQLFAG